MRRIRPAGVLLALVTSATQADPGALLLQAGSAAPAYDGVVVYRTAQGTEVLRVSHRTVDGRAQDRFTTLTGAPREVSSGAAGLACSFEGGAARTVADSPGLAPPEPAILSGGSNYDLREAGTGRVAGRGCRGVSVAPRDGFRYGYEVCIDELTAVPLKIVLLDASGRSLESLTFTEIGFDSRAAAPAPRTVRKAASVSAPAEPSRWSFGALPPGFAVASRAWLPARGARPPVEHVMLSDGLSAISVFAAPSTPADAGEGLSRMGAVNAYVRKLGDLHLTVMGEVPEAAVRLIGDALAPAGGAATAVSAR